MYGTIKATRTVYFDCGTKNTKVSQDIRDLATFIECVNKENFYNKYGRLIRTEWTCNLIYDEANLQAYLGSREKKYVAKTVKFVFNANIYNCYNDRYYLPMFYKGKEGQDFVLTKCKDVDFSPQGFEEYHKKHSVDIPETYRGKRKKIKKEEKEDERETG